MRRLFAISIALLLPGPAFADAVPIEPGEWEIRTMVESVEVPGMPPEAAAMMGQGKLRTHRRCITAEDAEKGPEALVKESGGDCKFTEYSLRNNRISAVMECTQPQGSMTVTTKGQYTRTSFSTATNMTMTGGSGMHMKTSNSGTRVGPCQ